jgi:transcriptional regulator with XRE-family HTH domain
MNRITVYQYALYFVNTVSENQKSIDISAEFRYNSAEGRQPMRSFGGILRTQRRKLKLTQRQIADSVGVSDAYICSLESDKKSPPPYYTVAAIADALQLDAEQLWKVAVRYREKQAVERSRHKAMTSKRNRGTGDDFLQRGTVSDSQIDTFFDRPEIQMTTFGLFQKQPKEMTMEEKRVVYRAINGARDFISKRTDEPTRNGG